MSGATSTNLAPQIGNVLTSDISRWIAIFKSETKTDHKSRRSAAERRWAAWG
jgi:hypothetical protein